VWECLAKVALPSYKRTNIGPKTFDAVFIGYAQNSAAYRFMSLNDYVIFEHRDAEFFEHVFSLKRGVTDVASINPSISVKLLDSSSNDRILESEPIRSKRRRVETNFGPDFITAFLIEYCNSSDVDVITEEFVSNFLIEEDLKTYQEAIKSIDATFWKEAIKSEIDSLESNKT